jgi:hypothetical protein
MHNTTYWGIMFTFDGMILLLIVGKQLFHVYNYDFKKNLFSHITHSPHLHHVTTYLHLRHQPNLQLVKCKLNASIQHKGVYVLSNSRSGNLILNGLPQGWTIYKVHFRITIVIKLQFF